MCLHFYGVKALLYINFLFFGVTIILAVIENFWSFIFLIISLISVLKTLCNVVHLSSS
jgi:TM2 domain-containing membrane protein YozV